MASVIEYEKAKKNTARLNSTDPSFTIRCIVMLGINNRMDKKIVTKDNILGKAIDLSLFIMPLDIFRYNEFIFVDHDIIH